MMSACVALSLVGGLAERPLVAAVAGVVHGLTLAVGPFDAPTSLKVKTCQDLVPLKRLTLSEEIPLDTLKDIKNAAGCTVNDVLCCVLAGCIRRYPPPPGLSAFDHDRGWGCEYIHCLAPPACASCALLDLTALLLAPQVS